MNGMNDIVKIMSELAKEYPKGLIAFGGIAVYVHALHSEDVPSQTTHDIDFYLSLVNLSTMRDVEEIVKNDRLKKSQITRNGFEIDIYIEHQHNLALDFETVSRYSEMLSGITVAAKEHLLILKTDAAINRSGSGKGVKDLKDLASIVLMTKYPKSDLLKNNLDAKRLSVLENLATRNNIFEEITGGNVHQASKIRGEYTKNLESITKSLEDKRGRGR